MSSPTATRSSLDETTRYKGKETFLLVGGVFFPKTPPLMCLFIDFIPGLIFLERKMTYFYIGMLLLLISSKIMKMVAPLWYNQRNLSLEALSSTFSREDIAKAHDRLDGWKRGRIDFVSDILLNTAVWGTIFAFPLLLTNDQNVKYGVLIMLAQLALRLILVLSNYRMGYGMEATIKKNGVVVANFDITGYSLFHLNGEDYHNERTNIHWLSFLNPSAPFAFRGSLIGRRIKASTFLDSSKFNEEILSPYRDSFKKIIEENPLFVCGVEYDPTLQIRGKVVFKEYPLTPGAHPNKQFVIEVELYSRLVGYDDMHKAQSYSNILIHDHFMDLS